MTYCVAMRLNDGLVFLSDSRTNAGVDHISTFRKMTVFEHPGQRVMTLMSAGNLAIGQAVCQQLSVKPGADGASVWTVDSMYDAARLVGDAVRVIHERDGEALKNANVEFNCTFIFGGQIGAEAPRLFQIYSAGNFIEATPENPYFQIGEEKYGKPIIDRIITPITPLDEAAKCALISMDSTLRSNISVGLPLDLLVYEKDALRVTRFVQIDQSNQYFEMIHKTWGKRLKQIFLEIPDPTWGRDGSRFAHEDYRLGQKHAGASASEPQHQPPRAPLPSELGGIAKPVGHGEAIQSVAQAMPSIQRRS